jgi:hypothetical protein
MYFTYVIGMHRRHHHHGRGSRSRRQIGPGKWDVRARVERFHEPSLLLLLKERPRHGYELIELLPELSGGHRVDVGNLYRFLRGRPDPSPDGAAARDRLRLGIPRGAAPLRRGGRTAK